MAEFRLNILIHFLHKYGVTDKLTIVEPNSLVARKDPNTIGHKGTS